MADYEAMLHEFGQSYGDVKQTSRLGEINQLYHDSYTEFTIPNEQIFDYEGLKGRLMSSSYAPKEGNPQHKPMIKRLRSLFDQYQQDGVVAFNYDTHVFAGRPK